MTILNKKYPIALLREVEKEMKGILPEQLFNDSQYQKIIEKWSAAVFGLGYDEHVTECMIEMVEEEQNSIDFYLWKDGEKYPFQLTETQEDGRRRGKEYKERAGNFLLMKPYRPERGKLMGPEWIYKIVRNKVARNYSDMKSLNLLVYANFDAADFERDRIKSELESFKNHFASIWIMTNTAICSIFANLVIGELNSWGIISDIYPYGNKIRDSLPKE